MRPYDINPGGNLNPVSSPQPFAQWELDIIRPFLRASRNWRYVIVDTNYFMKWMEAEALANIRDVDVKSFVWKNIITRFRVPRALVSDNGLQFDSKVFQDYCNCLRISNKCSTPTCPQSNGQAEATNKKIINGLKKRLEGAKGGWVDELPNVLQAYRATSRRSPNETSLSLTCGIEAVIPIEISLLSPRVACFEQGSNKEGLISSLDMLEERREMVSVRLADYLQRLAQIYNMNVRPREFAPANLVLRKAVRNTRDQNTASQHQTGKAPIE